DQRSVVHCQHGSSVCQRRSRKRVGPIGQFTTENDKAVVLISFMPDETQAPTPIHQSLDDVLAECIAAEEAGQPLDREQLLQTHPQFADDLREFFANRDQMQRLAQPLRGSGDANRATTRPLGKVRYFGDYELLEEIAV